jgi:DNA-binding XRE family transcriptional regulator
MKQKRFLEEQDLAALAQRFRTEAGKTRAQAARDMDVAQTSIFHAEESPAQSFVKLRRRMIEAYSRYALSGPVFYLTKK